MPALNQGGPTTTSFPPMGLGGVTGAEGTAETGSDGPGDEGVLATGVDGGGGGDAPT